MRRLRGDLSAHLKSGVTTLCYVWRLTLKDGRVFGFTDHDAALVFEGLTCTPDSGLTAGEQDGRLGTASQISLTTGILSSTQINAGDIRSGHYDGATLELFRVNWQDPGSYVHMSTGTLGDISWRGGRFEAEWRGPAHKLSRSYGRVFTRNCDAQFGDARCGLDKTSFPDGTTCPRSFSACRDQFSNALNFRGQPYLIGDDALTAAPKAGELRDGGSRYKS